MAGIRKSVGQVAATEFREAVKAGKSFPCVLLIGPENYLREKDSEAYLGKLLPPEQRDFDLTRISAEDMKAPELRAALNELPLLGATRVLYMDNPADLSDETAAVLKSYLKAPSPELRLLLVEPEAKPQDKPLKELLPSLLWIHYQPLKKENQRIEWIITYLQGHGKKITTEAAQYIAQTSKISLTEIAAKLDNTALFVGDVEEVDIFAAQRATGITSEVSIYQLEDALHSGSLAQCLRVSRALLEGGETVLHLIAYLHWSLFRLWKIKATSRRKNRDELHRQILGSQFWKRDAFVSAARRMSVATLERALTGLLDLEITLKTRSVEGDILFYHWLCEVLSKSLRTAEPAAATES